MKDKHKQKSTSKKNNNKKSKIKTERKKPSSFNLGKYAQNVNKASKQVYKDLIKNKKYLLFFFIILIIGTYLSVLTIPLASIFTLSNYSKQDNNTILDFGDEKIILNYSVQNTTEDFLQAQVYGKTNYELFINGSISGINVDRNLVIFQETGTIFSKKLEEGKKQVDLNICSVNKCITQNYEAFVYSEEQKEFREKFTLTIFLISFIVVLFLFYFNLKKFSFENTKALLSSFAVLIPLIILFLLQFLLEPIKTILSQSVFLLVGFSYFVLSTAIMIFVTFFNFLIYLFKSQDKINRQGMLIFIFLLVLILWPFFIAFPFFAYLLLIMILATYIFLFTKKENQKGYFTIILTLVGILFTVSFIHPVINPILLDYSEETIIDMSNNYLEPQSSTFINAKVKPALFDYPLGYNSLRFNIPQGAFISSFGNNCARFRSPENDSIRVIFTNGGNICNIQINYTRSAYLTSENLRNYVTNFSQSIVQNQEFVFEQKVRVEIIHLTYQGNLEIHNYPFIVSNSGDSVYFVNGKINSLSFFKENVKYLPVNLIPNSNIIIVKIPNADFYDSNLQLKLIEIVRNIS